MRIVVAPDSFKESLTASAAAAAMAEGVARAWPAAQCVQVPLADGGEGTLAVLADAFGAQLRTIATTDPLGRPVLARYGLAGDVAIIEVATAIGLELIAPELRDIEKATTVGVAALLTAALDAGATRLIVGIGGTATCDGGAGLLAGLGARLLDADGAEVPPTPAGLARLARVELAGLEPRLAEVGIEIASDVTNPLLGPLGAAAVFAPQKGAKPDQLPLLENSLSRLAEALVAAGAADVRDTPGAGAAGGLGAALLAVGGRLRSGVGLVAEAVGLAEQIAGADLVLTGEGALDAQTRSGKVVAGVVAVAARYRVPVIAFAGRIPDPKVIGALGLAGAVAITTPELSFAQAVEQAPELLSAAVADTLAAWPKGPA